METNLNDVRVFTRVVDAGSFTGAAQLLDLPTSTVSRRVARLEEELGVRLLHRTTRRLSLTAPGKLYFERCSRIVEEFADAEREVTQAQATPKGRVRVTAPVDFSVVSNLASGFLHDFPDVHLELDLTNRRIDLVEEGYDVALRAGILTDSSLVAYKLAESTMTLVASPDYLRERGEPRRINDLTKHDCIVFGKLGPQATWPLRSKKETVTVTVTGRISVNHLQAAKSAALAGLGIAMIPGAYCGAELRDGTLAAVLPKIGAPAGGMWLVVPNRHMAPAARAFVEYIRANFDQMGLE
jgi:DNA-binding transcriptional LysR family regulator